MKSRVQFSSQTDNWNTPKSVYQTLDAEFGFDFDPCPEKPTADGLSIDWGAVNFVNPPYSEIEKWVRKGFSEYLSGKTVVLLIPSRTDTRWWHDCCMKASEIRFIKGRLKFGGAKHNAPFPSVVVIFKPTTTRHKGE